MYEFSKQSNHFQNFHNFNKYDIYGTLHVFYTFILKLHIHKIKEKPCFKGLNYLIYTHKIKE